MDAADNFKQAQRAMWAAGDFPTMATTIQGASDVVVERLGAAEAGVEVEWGEGDEARVRELFSNARLELRFERHAVAVAWESIVELAD